MNFSYKEKPNKESFHTALKLYDIHLINQAAKTKEFCEKWHLNYFKIQMSNLSSFMASTFFDLKNEYSCGKVIIFLNHYDFSGSLAQKGHLGFYVPDRHDPKIFLIDAFSGEVESHFVRADIEVDGVSNHILCEYKEF